MVYHDKPRLSAADRNKRIAAVLIPVLLAIVLCAWLFLRVHSDVRAQAAESLKQEVVEAAVQCYAVEGVYPSDITYLVQNYGVRYNAARFSVVISTPDSNLLPEVTVTQLS